MAFATFDEFVSYCKSSVKAASETFTEPDDDFIPILMIESDDGVTVAALDPSFLKEENKERLGRGAIPSLLIEWDAIRFAFISSSFMTIKNNEEEVRRAVRPSQDPERIEAVTLSAGERSGEFLLDAAMILRPDDQAPSISGWSEGDLERVFPFRGKLDMTSSELPPVEGRLVLPAILTINAIGAVHDLVDEARGLDEESRSALTARLMQAILDAHKIEE